MTMFMRMSSMYTSMYIVEVERRWPSNFFHALRANHLFKVRVLSLIGLVIVTRLVIHIFEVMGDCRRNRRHNTIADLCGGPLKVALQLDRRHSILTSVFLPQR